MTLEEVRVSRVGLAKLGENVTQLELLMLAVQAELSKKANTDALRTDAQASRTGRLRPKA